VASLGTQAKTDVNAEVSDVLKVDVFADTISTDGSRPTFEQAIREIRLYLFERAVSGASVSVKAEDGTTEKMTFTLDSATAPTSVTRTT
jgi:hypothetical protein